jgi:RimJ/RimL family protein N-acetyltransferase
MTFGSLYGKRVTLRPLRLSDAHALNAVLRDRRVSRFLPPRVRDESGMQFVRRVLFEGKRDGVPAFAILPAGLEEVVGQIRFVDWSRSDRKAEVGYWLRRRFWGRGLGTEALLLVCRFGFGKMSLRRIEAKVLAGNLRSRRLLEKVGFRLEGQSRLSGRLAGRWVDEWTFGLLRGELRGD